MRDDAPALGRSVEREGEGRVGVRGLDQDAVLQVVPELQIRAAPRHGRVAAERIVREVEVVVRALENRQAGLERVVEERGRRLADAAADRREDERADDFGSFEEAPLGGARADDAVEREDLARLDHGAVDEVGHQVDVVDPVRGRHAHLRRVRDELLADPEGFRLGGRQIRRARGERQLGDAAFLDSGLDGGRDLVRREVESRLGRRDAHHVPLHDETARCGRARSTCRAAAAGS